MPLKNLSLPFLFLFSVVSGCAVSTPNDDPADSESSAQTLSCATPIQQGVDALHAAGITGVLLEVDDGHDRHLARSGVAELGSGRPVAFDSNFRMGSDTKTFVAVVTLQLVGEKKLSLDDTVDAWLPGVLSGNGYDGKSVTIHQLLQHTSGIANYTQSMPWFADAAGFMAHRFDHFEAEALVQLALQSPPNFAPGTAWSYSNTNYILLGMIIKKVTGRDWSNEVRSRILLPLGLHDTFNPGDSPDLPTPHADAYQQFTPGDATLTDVTRENLTVGGAAGAVITTTRDLARFWRALQSGSLLRPAEMTAMHDTVLATTVQQFWPGARYGLGIMWFPSPCGTGYWAHEGDTFGFATRNAVSDDGSRVAILSETTELADPTQKVMPLEGDLLGKIICADRVGR